MKKYLLLILALTQLHLAFCQGLKDQNSFAETLALAAQSNKPVFIILRSPNTDMHTNTAFGPKKVSDFYNKNFISYEFDAADTTASKITNLFNIDGIPSLVFLDSKGQVVYRPVDNFPAADNYIDVAQEALNRIKSGKTVSHFIQLDQQGKLKTAAQIRSFIDLRMELKLKDDQALLDRYVSILAVKDLDDYDKVLYVLKAGPIVYSKTYNLVNVNRKLIDSIFKTEPLAVRQALNTHIIRNSHYEAVRTKNMALAQNIASYAQISWGKDYKKAYQTYSAEMLAYYRAVKDTNNFYNQGGYFFDQNYLNISADSARKMQLKSTDQASGTWQATPSALNENGGKMVMQFVQSPYSTVAGVLNNAAWDFYTFGTHNNIHLIKALFWSKRSIELQPIYNYYDTMAHILYRLRMFDEAELNERKAIDMAAAVPLVVSEKEKTFLAGELQKMKDRSL